MHLAFLNPQGNFDPTDRGWTEHPDFGGQLVYVKEVALALAARGHRVDLLTRRMEDPDWEEFSGAEDAYPEVSGVRILRFPCGPRGFLRKEDLWPHLPEWTRHILAFYRGEGRAPDAVTGHYADGGLAAAWLRHAWRVPSTFTAHSLGADKLAKLLETRPDLDALCDRYHFERRLPAERLAMAWAGRVITSTRQERREQYGHPAYEGAASPRDDGFSVVPPGVNFEVFGHDRVSAVEEAVGAKVEAMLERDLPPERRDLPVVICSSRLDEKKNHLRLVQAWQASGELRRSANLVLAVRGSSDPLRRRREVFQGEALEILEAIVRVLDDGELWPMVSAFDLASQAELAACYRHLARRRRGIFALTTLHEPFGLAPLEAMAAGLPAVVTKYGGPSETLRDGLGEYGVLVDPFDPDDIARGLLRLASDEEEHRRLRDAGLRRVEERFTWGKTAEGYLAALEAAREAPLPEGDPWEVWESRSDAADRGWLRRVFGG